MDLTRAAIEKNRITGVALLIVAVGGMVAFTNMSRAEDPGFIIRTAQVLTIFPGASPERVENLVTDKLEKAIQEMPELDFVTSTSKTGVSIVMVNIREEFTDMRPIWDSLRRKVDKTAPDLPDDIVGPTVNDEFGDVFGVIITIAGDGFSYAELKEVADEVRDELLRIDEVAKVDIYGAQEERIFVDYDSARLAELGLSPLQLRQILEGANIIIPGGDVSTGVERIVLEPTGNFESIEDLRQTVVTLPGRQAIVYLGDLADIYRGYIDPPSNTMHTSGQAALGLAISMREGGNIVTLGDGVSRELARLQGVYPLGVDFDVVAFQPDVVDRKVDEFVVNLLQAVVIVLVVMLAFLGIRTGLVVSSLVPMAMIMAILVMSALGIGLDQMSLASLIIALGMLVDNAIVMSESIMVEISEGKRPVQAAIDSARELRFPLLISSLTTSAAFLPIYLSESSTGEYTAPLFKVVTITLLSSWLLAITMTPLLCVWFLKAGRTSSESTYDTRFYRAYRGWLVAALKHPVLSLSLVFAMFVISLGGFQLIPNIFFPPSDKGIFTAEFQMPPGTSVERTEAVVREVEEFVARELRVTGAVGPDGGFTSAGEGPAVDGGGRTEGVTNWATFVGRGGPRFYLSYSPEPSSPDYAFAIVNATSRAVIDDVIIPRLETFCFEQFPELDVTLNPLQMGPPVMAPVQVRLSGRDPDRLFDIVETVKSKLRTLPGTKNISDDWGPRSKKLVVQVDQPRARRAGVTNQDIAISLQTALSGFVTTQFREEDEIIPVSLRSADANRTDVTGMTSLNVYAQTTGRSVPLLQVADVEVVWQAAKVRRRNRLKTVTVSSEVESGTTPRGVVGELQPWLDAEQTGWGLGYLYEFGGEQETSVKANEAIGEQVPTGALIILLLLVLQFNSLRRTLIIVLTIPLGIIGVVIGLLVAQSYFGFMTLLGIIALSGIVINNAIVLIDRIAIETEENGLEPARAVVEAAQRRFRPILLTTATTVMGLIPLWLGGGPMWEPLAITIMSGLLFATLLTLGVVPILYSLFFRVRFKDFVYS